MVLVVDDTPANLSLLSHLLKDRYRVRIANNGPKALELAMAAVPDLVLLDVMMPGMDGFEVCRRLKTAEITARVPVIFLTADTDPEHEALGLAIGAADFIRKPISAPTVLARIKTQLEVQSWRSFLLDQNEWLRKQVNERLTAVNRLQDALICVMVSLAEFRDDSTGNHIRCTREYVRLLAHKLSEHPHYRAFITSHYVEQVSKSAPLHDIGKIAIPDHILLKPSKLTPEEFEIMKTHAQRGCEMLAQAGEHMGDQGEFLRIATEIAGCHHEKWDGTGYPQGLAGNAIPLSARLMAVADVFDALMSRRPYKGPMKAEEVFQIIIDGRGTHFDPDMVDAFLASREDFLRVASQWRTL
ncbi:response regulator-like protein [Candidatus Symbiobacter mobilis CR]|uniref:Response regulator-like protein n=2 Tax=Candidatus Symbiobacter TaxID=1436289 RepID=U5N965_9BURK|nr:response regulator-like protein [Candidatus Symbiobacter mobilis CR]